MIEEDRKKGLNDALCYVDELEKLYDISIELIDSTQDIMKKISMTHAISSPVGKDRILDALDERLDPYSGETILGINRDVLEDIKFLTKGLTHIMEEKYAYGL